jgi:Fe(3+) dicitrate transport protein
MKKAVLLFLLIYSCMIRAQQISVRGFIEKADTNRVTITIGKQSRLTESSGHFHFRIQPGQYLIKLSGREMLKLNFTKDTFIILSTLSKEHKLEEITINAGGNSGFGVSRMNNIEGTTVYAGKKSEAVYLESLNTNVSANNSRQIYSKIPGINAFENDGSGNSVGIGGRGLNPNRISNFNTRQNGYDISADALGYPESYYTPAAEAIERIEILRGAAGLQFGTQFGGMINYRFTEPSSRKLSGIFSNTGGSFGYFNTFSQLVQKKERTSYNVFYQYKHYDGWRARSASNSHNVFGAYKWEVNERLSIKAELTILNYLAQQPGGVTDRQFDKSEFGVSRTRNWFRVKWNLAAITASYRLSDNTRMSLVVFGLDAQRDALGVLSRADRSDDTSANRNLLSDHYRNIGGELRLLHRYLIKGNNCHFLIGTRIYYGNTRRMQGDADKSDEPRFNFLNPANLENSSYLFPSVNYAVFTENVFQLTKKWSVTPGARLEYINTAAEGYYRLLNKNLAGTILLDRQVQDNRENARVFLLGGLGTQYKFSDETDVYANISQNYRSINFSDMRVLNPNFQVDPQLKDERGFTADAGFRRSVKDVFYLDAGIFYIAYNNRIGTTIIEDSATYQLIRYRTNIGQSRNMGIECFTELDWLKLKNRATKHKLSTFVNFSLIDAKYTSEASPFYLKKVEYVPEVIIRSGLTYGFKKFSVTYQCSYTSEQYSDATNSKFTPSAIYGLIPAYLVMDLTSTFTYKKVTLNAGINNLLNTIYFTRRAEGYPGPGIIPADPLNVYLGVKVKL